MNAVDPETALQVVACVCGSGVVRAGMVDDKAAEEVIAALAILGRAAGVSEDAMRRAFHPMPVPPADEEAA